MKMRIALVSVLLLVANASVQAAPLTAAVYNFTDSDKNSGGYGGKVTTLVTANLTAETNLIMLERADLAKALNEQSFDASGMVSSDAAAKIGEITGAKVLIAGQVIKVHGERLVIVANIVSTETGRLFSAKVDGPTDNLLELTSDLSRKIAQTITEQTTNLLGPTEESYAAHMARIIKGIQGTNRPTVSIHIKFFGAKGTWPDVWAEHSFGKVLMEAGFTVVNEKADRKSDLMLTGDSSAGVGPTRGDLVTRRSAIEIKLQERRTGNIIAFDRQESTVTGVGDHIVDRASRDKAVYELSERILPIMAK